MNISEKSKNYNLYSTERIYRKNTLISYYFQSNRKIIKKFKPIDVNGERLRLNLITGELTYYKKKEVEKNKNTSLRRTHILMNMLMEMNDFYWFWTLTFDNERIDRTNDSEVFNCYKKYINNLNHKYPKFRYMCFSERHEDGNIHFHLLVGGISPKEMGLVNSGKVCCHWATKKNGVCSKEYYDKTKNLHVNDLKDTDGEPIYNVTTFVYGYTTVTRICNKERCNSYCKKYVEKAIGSTDDFKKRFYYSRNLQVPEMVKRLVGADFEVPEDIEKLNILKNNDYIKSAISAPYISDYNVLQIRIDNKQKALLDAGFELVNEELVFDSYHQQTIEDELY